LQSLGGCELAGAKQRDAIDLLQMIPWQFSNQLMIRQSLCLANQEQYS
jgi:hypothetical protein